MAKARRYYYECLFQTQLGYWGPDQRKERWIQKGPTLIQPQRVQHVIVVNPSRGMTARGEQIPPDYIVTDKPLAKQYTEEVSKRVSRPSFDPATGRRNGRYFRRKTSKIKFRLLDVDEVDTDVKRRAYDLPWQETLFEDATKDVILPKDVAIMDKALPEAMGNAVGAETNAAD